MDETLTEESKKVLEGKLHSLLELIACGFEEYEGWSFSFKKMRFVKKTKRYYLPESHIRLLYRYVDLIRFELGIKL